MKKIIILLVTTLTIFGCSKDESSEKNNNPNPIYLDDNGVTIKSYDWGEVGDIGEIDGEEFVIISENELRERLKDPGNIYNVVKKPSVTVQSLFSRYAHRTCRAIRLGTRIPYILVVGTFYPVD